MTRSVEPNLALPTRPAWLACAGAVPTWPSQSCRAECRPADQIML